MTRLYMLDTNIVSALAHNPQGEVARKIAMAGDKFVCISIITAAELRYGCAKKNSARLWSQINTILDSITILPLDVPVDDKYGNIRSKLESKGKMIGPNDLLIAAHAQAAGAVMVTANTREFERVSNLDVENWLDQDCPDYSGVSCLNEGKED